MEVKNINPWVVRGKEYLAKHPNMLRYEEGQIIKGLSDEVERLEKK